MDGVSLLAVVVIVISFGWGFHELNRRMEEDQQNTNKVQQSDLFTVEVLKHRALQVAFDHMFDTEGLTPWAIMDELQAAIDHGLESHELSFPVWVDFENKTPNELLIIALDLQAAIVSTLQPYTVVPPAAE